MNLVVFSPSSVDLDQFVKFWSAQYSYRQSDDLYSNNIANPFSVGAITELFEWKNGSRLSTLKRLSVEQNFIARVAEAKGMDVNADPAEFLRAFSKGGAIWRIFWMHCWNQKYPIYDQHVHRAMTYIENGEVEEIGHLSDEKKIEFYLARYLPFARQFRTEDPRKTDQALWAFGKFLKAWTAQMEREPQSTLLRDFGCVESFGHVIPAPVEWSYP